MATPDIGVVGMAVMGQNLAMNMANHGFTVAVYNRTTAKTDEFVAANPGASLVPSATIEEFVASIPQPRKIMLMVQAGRGTDAVIEELTPLLAPGDTIIDGGNSFFRDTDRRAAAAEAAGLNYLGVGVSGGEEGALKGPSLMPGGQRDAYAAVAPIFEAIAGRAQDDTPVVAYMGPRSAGHYVKMVHNGIEYGDMQLIAEAYDILRRIGGLTPAELADVFAEWNAGELKSYLIEITADIFRREDSEMGKPLVEVILDSAAQKGTGKWTSQNALDLGAPIPTIDAAVAARFLSARKDERVAASKVLHGPTTTPDIDRDELIAAVRAALYASKVCSYAQGMALLASASREFDYELDLGEVASIWRAGCIIRAVFLDDITAAFRRNASLPNLLLDEFFLKEVASRQDSWRRVIQLAVAAGVPVPAFSISLAYFDAYRSERLPANLVQAQRDYFGAHTFERIDKPGSFHTEWITKVEG
jgi:6-phosphogluconate dehydrogenase